MKQIYVFLFVLLLGNTVSAQWIKLINPESGVLGKEILKENVWGDGVDSTYITTEVGVNSITQRQISDFKSFLGFGSFNNFKLDSTHVENLVVDYIKNEELQKGKYKNKWVIYKGKRAKKVILKFKKSSIGESKPKEVLTKLLKQEILEKIPFLDSLNITYKNDKDIYVTIENPKVYFEVFVVKIRKIDTKYQRSFLTGSTKNKWYDKEFTLTFPNNRDITNNPVLKGVKNNPRFNLSFKMDEKDNLNLYLEMGSEFANKNGYKSNEIILSNKYIGKTKEGYKIYEYKILEKLLGKESNNKSKEFYIYLDLEAEFIENKESNKITFTNYKNSYFKTRLYYPMLKYKIYKGKIKS